MVVILDTGPKSGVCPDSVCKPVATRIVPSIYPIAISLPLRYSITLLEWIICVLARPDLRKFFSQSANRFHTDVHKNHSSVKPQPRDEAFVGVSSWVVWIARMGPPGRSGAQNASL